RAMPPKASMQHRIMQRIFLVMRKTSLQSLFGNRCWNALRAGCAVRPEKGEMNPLFARIILTQRAPKINTQIGDFPPIHGIVAAMGFAGYSAGIHIKYQ
ncbi:MAG: hypothetical protein J5602_08580, partial [Clostridia bacterium]|nr:hypothetical protein [Clostridia bacterium]